MSLTLEDGSKSKPLAVIRGKSDKKLNNEILYATMETGKRCMQEMELEGDMKFQVIPDISMERNICYVAGRSGAGKSFYCASWLKEYKKVFPDNLIYLFSEVDRDEVLDAVGVNRIKIDMNLVTHPIKLEEFANCCVVFDDIDDIDNSKIRKAVFNIMDRGLQMGRHHHISMMVTYHLLNNNKETRKILNESQFVTIFPKSGRIKGMKYFLEQYMELDKGQRNKIKNLSSRWVTIRNCNPTCVISEHEAYVLKDVPDE